MNNAIELKPIDTQEAQRATKETAEMLGRATGIVIATQQDYNTASLLLRMVKDLSKKLDEERRKITKPIDQAKKAVMDLFRKPQGSTIEAEKIIKTKMIAWDNEQERKRKAEEDRLRKEAEEKEKREKDKLLRKAEKAEQKGNEEKAEELREEAEDVTVIAPTIPKAEKTEGSHFTKKWYAEVVDKSKIPLQYMQPDMDKLNKQARATKDEIEVPGVVFKFEKVLVSRLVINHTRGICPTLKER